MAKNFKSISDAINELVEPELRLLGFSGKYPHYRRMRGAVTDLVTFQVNKYGGSFIIVMAQWNAESYKDNYLGTITTRNELTAHTLRPEFRYHLKPWWKHFAYDGSWFRYDSLWQKIIWKKPKRLAVVARRVVRYLPWIDRSLRDDKLLRLNQIK